MRGNAHVRFGGQHGGNGAGESQPPRPRPTLLKPLRPPQDEDLHDLIAERYERAATIVTSNLDFAEWGDAFPNRLLGAATLDRLRDGAYRVILDGESYRKPKPLKTNSTKRPSAPKSAAKE